ncbi:UNVERIFIED_CONTAM: hypothetical protein GTU68_001075 [Idotea baltica]|nr:hypothetical protein [Idotea baltica]
MLLFKRNGLCQEVLSKMKNH